MAESNNEGRNSVFMLDRLPAELVGQILSYEGLALGCLCLWKSGSPRLMQSIRKSVSAVTLEGQLRDDFAFLPEMLTELSSLRSLTLDQSHHEVLGYTHTLKVLKSLSSTLERLVIRFKGAAEMCDLEGTANRYLPPQHVFDPATYGTIDLVALFPRLQSLSFGGSDRPLSCLIFPPTLTELSFVLFDPKTAPICFPPTLLRLKVCYISETWAQSFTDALPLGLEYLDLTCHVVYSSMLGHLKALPRGLKTLALPRINPDDFSSAEFIAALPPKLESLSNVNHSHVTELNRVIRRLKVLHLDGDDYGCFLSASHVRKLSRAMTSLEMRLLDMHNMLAGDFPPHLTRLSLTLQDDFTSSYPLPAHLLSLTLFATAIDADSIRGLPATLTFLKLNVDDFLPSSGTIALPPSLTTFIFLVWQSDLIDSGVFGQMPDSITHLHLGAPLRFNEFLALPRFLRHLKVDTNESLRTQIDTSEYRARIQDIHNAALQSGLKVELLSSSGSPCFLDLLPRTLEYLELGHLLSPRAAKNLQAHHWASLPRNLKTFKMTCRYERLATDALDYFPLETITILNLECGVTWKDDHVKRLNPRMIDLTTGYEASEWLTTSACAPWIPRNPAMVSWPVPLRKPLAERIEGQTKKAIAMDRSGFYELLKH